MPWQPLALHPKHHRVSIAPEASMIPPSILRPGPASSRASEDDLSLLRPFAAMRPREETKRSARVAWLAPLARQRAAWRRGRSFPHRSRVGGFLDNSLGPPANHRRD